MICTGLACSLFSRLRNKSLVAESAQKKPQSCCQMKFLVIATEFVFIRASCLLQADHPS